MSLKFSIFVLSCIIASPAFAKTAQHFYQQSVQAFEQGDLKRSAEIAQRIIKAYPRFKAAYHIVGRIHYRQGDLNKAGRAFARSGLYDLNPSNAFEMGISLYTARRYREATKALNVVPKTHPSASIANVYLGGSYLRIKEYRKAEIHLARAQNLPQDFEMYRQKLAAEANYKIQMKARSIFQSQQRSRIPYGGLTPLQPGPTQIPLPAGIPPQGAMSRQPGLLAAISPHLGYLYQSESNELHGYGTSEESIQGAISRLDARLGYFFGDSETLHAIGLDALLYWENRGKQGRRSELRQSGSSIFSYGEAFSAPAENNLSAYARPFARFQFGNYFSAHVDGSFGQTQGRFFFENPSYDALVPGSVSTTAMGRYSPDQEIAEVLVMGGTLGLHLNVAQTRLSILGGYDANETLNLLDQQLSHMIAAKGEFSQGFSQGVAIDLSVLHRQRSENAFRYFSQQDLFYTGISEFLERTDIAFAMRKDIGWINLSLGGGYMTAVGPEVQFVEIAPIGTYEELRGRIDLSFDFSLGIHVILGGGYVHSPETVVAPIYLSTDINPVTGLRDGTRAQTERETIFTNASVRITPEDWIHFEGALSLELFTYQLRTNADDSDFKINFERSTPDQSIGQVFFLEISKRF